MGRVLASVSGESPMESGGEQGERVRTGENGERPPQLAKQLPSFPAQAPGEQEGQGQSENPELCQRGAE